jgi:branched-chain amino acid transport system substrate-binding protein
MAAGATLLGACSGSSGAGPSSTPGVVTAVSEVPSVAPSTAAKVDDGVLRVGVLLPLTGPGAGLGLSMKATVDLAVSQINDAGGVTGQSVEVRIADEGADIATATKALDDLIGADVDAVIGPASSTVALSLLGTVRRNQVLTCSPTATALTLDAYPDDGLFFRTVPSDSLQAEAIARAIDLTGRASVGILYVDDAYGRPFATKLTDALGERSIAVSANIPYSMSTSDDFAGAAEQLVRAGAEAVAIIGDGTTGPRVAVAVLGATAGSEVPVIVNDAMRGQPAAGVFTQLPIDELSRLQGVAPRALSDNVEFAKLLHDRAPGVSGLFAVNAYDCMNLVALAAEAAGSTTSRDIAGRIPAVANGGTRCQSFPDCADDLHANRNIDYDGPSGQLQLDLDGDPNHGVFDLFGFESDGTERALGSLTVNV